MRAILDVILLALQIYVWLLIAAAVLSWLIAFNVVNTRNPFVHTVGEFLYRITEPALRPIRNMMPNLGGNARAQVRRDGLAVDDPCGHDGHVYRAPERFSSAAASPAASPTIFTRLMRAVAPPTISTRDSGTPSALARTRQSASFAAPSCGAGRTSWMRPFPAGLARPRPARSPSWRAALMRRSRASRR